MAVRPTMAALISEVYLLLGDLEHVLFDPQVVQDMLDRTMRRANNESLRYVIDREPGTGVILYNEYHHTERYWEDGMIFQGVSYVYAIQTPLTSDNMAALWTFNNVIPPITLTGKTYDPHLAGAFLCDIRAAGAADATDYTMDGGGFKLDQLSKHWTALGQLLRSQAKIMTIYLDQPDLR